MLRFQRGNRLIIADNKTEDIYKFYKTNKNDIPKVNKSIFHNLLKDAYPEIIKMVVLDNTPFKMPRMGALRVKKKLVQPSLSSDGLLNKIHLSIDYKKTKQYWEKLYEGKTPEEIHKIEGKPIIRELNEHTDGYRVHWHWDKNNCSLINKSYYQLLMTRTNKLFLSHSVKTINNLNFYE